MCLLSQVEWEKRFYSASLDTLGNLIYKKPYKGNVLDFYYDGNIKTKGQYVNGLMSGMWTYYYPNGVINLIRIILNGMPMDKRNMIILI